MKIATWNVNSIKARQEHALRWAGEKKPEIILLQELKGLEFPTAPFEALGYKIETVPQKTYNGVAVLARAPVKVVARALPGDDSDEQARYMEVEYQGVRIINIYAPNGNPVESEKFPYKLSWLARLEKRLAQLREERVDTLVAGDFNIIPEAADCYDPRAWKEDALFRPESRGWFRRFQHLGYTDALRVHSTGPDAYTYWDYQGGAWPAGKGIRIDHILLSPRLADRLVSCAVDRGPRGWDKASDHTPVVAELSAA